MKLQGKTINFLGDSITEGHGTSDSSKRFTALIEKRCGLKKANNYGIGGTRFAKQFKPSENPLFDKDFCGRVWEMEKNADIVVVFGGTNDYGHGDAPFGSFSDRTKDTFCGACHQLMRDLVRIYTGKPIVIITPLHRLYEEREDGENLENYVDIIKKTAKYYSLPVLDFFAESGIQPCVDEVREKLCPDGLHPNDEGHEIMAEKIISFLERI